jgi:hypothetical protein
MVFQKYTFCHSLLPAVTIYEILSLMHAYQLDYKTVLYRFLKKVYLKDKKNGKQAAKHYCEKYKLEKTYIQKLQ